MRSAGCCINDFADADIDGDVERTENRPLARGALTRKDALNCFLLLSLVGFLLVLMTNLSTVLLSVGALAVTAIYPFMKRYTNLPQVVLGIATVLYVAPWHIAITHQLGAVVLWVLILRARFGAKVGGGGSPGGGRMTLNSMYSLLFEVPRGVMPAGLGTCALPTPLLLTPRARCLLFRGQTSTTTPTTRLPGSRPARGPRWQGRRARAARRRAPAEGHCPAYRSRSPSQCYPYFPPHGGVASGEPGHLWSAPP